MLESQISAVESGSQGQSQMRKKVTSLSLIYVKLLSELILRFNNTDDQLNKMGPNSFFWTAFACKVSKAKSTLANCPRGCTAEQTSHGCGRVLVHENSEHFEKSLSVNTVCHCSTNASSDSVLHSETPQTLAGTKRLSVFTRCHFYRVLKSKKSNFSFSFETQCL